jgi:hypothetical protein
MAKLKLVVADWIHNVVKQIARTDGVDVETMCTVLISEAIQARAKREAVDDAD